MKHLNSIVSTCRLNILFSVESGEFLSSDDIDVRSSYAKIVIHLCLQM